MVEVAHNMADIKVRRLPVLNAEKRLVGIVSLADIALAEGPEPVGHALAEFPSRAASIRNRRTEKAWPRIDPRI